MISRSDTSPRSICPDTVEALCMLLAVPAAGCTVRELTVRLGLSPCLAEAVCTAVAELVRAGWIQDIDGRLAVTDTGRAWIRSHGGFAR